MTTPNTQNGQEKKTALDRLNELERVSHALHTQIQGVVQQFNSAIQNIVDVQRAIIKAVGVDSTGTDFDKKVNDQLALLFKEREDARVKREKDQIDQLLLTEQIVVADTVGSDSIVVGVEYNKEGTVLVSRVQAQLSQFSDQKVKESLLNQKVGAKISIGDGGHTFELTEIYNFAPAKPPVTQQESQTVPTTTPDSETPSPTQNPPPSTN